MIAKAALSEDFEGVCPKPTGSPRKSFVDTLLSTLRSYVNAMGGSLDLIVRFPDRPPVSLSSLFDKGGKRGGSHRKRLAPVDDVERHPA